MQQHLIQAMTPMSPLFESNLEWIFRSLCRNQAYLLLFAIASISLPGWKFWTVDEILVRHWENIGLWNRWECDLSVCVPTTLSATHLCECAFLCVSVFGRLCLRIVWSVGGTHRYHWICINILANIYSFSSTPICIVVWEWIFKSCCCWLSCLL